MNNTLRDPDKITMTHRASPRQKRQTDTRFF